MCVCVGWVVSGMNKNKVAYGNIDWQAVMEKWSGKTSYKVTPEQKSVWNENKVCGNIQEEHSKRKKEQM